MDRDRLDRLAARRGGLFTRADARACDFSAQQIDRRLEAGEWRRVVGSVLADAGVPLTLGLRDRAAQLAVPGSVLAGPSAARALAIPVDDPASYLLLRPHANTRITGVRVLYAAVAPEDVGAVAGVPCTRPERTIFDCLRILDRPRAAGLLDLALRRGWTTTAALTERIARAAGRRGTPRVTGLLREWNHLRPP